MVTSKRLHERVAVVAGATRGAGRGIARALGEAGATVYCTGRSIRGNPSPYGRSETIEETAELVTTAGGTGIPHRVDHAVEAEVRTFFEHVGREHRRVDVVVNAVAGENPMMAGWKSFWETDLEHGRDVLAHSVLSHVITAKYAAPMMIKNGRGLIVEITEGDAWLGGSGNILHDLVKSSTKQLAFRMAAELQPHGVAAIAITPGFLRTEAMLEHFGVTEENWRDAGKKDANFLESETPLFIGRGVVALAADPKILDRSGELTSSWELARDYGFSDGDGRTPDWGRHFERVTASLKWMVEGTERQIAWLDQISARAKRYVSAARVAETVGP